MVERRYRTSLALEALATRCEAEERLLADRKWRIREVKQGPDAIYIFAQNRLVRRAPQ